MRVINGLLIGCWAIVGLTSDVTAESQPALTNPSQIEVFYDNSTPIYDVDALRRQHALMDLTLYNLNTPDVLEDELGQGLPSNPQQAHQMLMARLEQIGRATLEKRFKAAYQGLIKAQTYGIDRFPAVVFDHGASVIYGISDLEAALVRYRQWRGAQ